MFTAYVIITVLAAGLIAYAAYVDFVGADWVIENMIRYGVPRSWLLPLGALKAAGALGLLVGIGIPPIGAAAAVGLVVYFIGAIATVLRARCYSHLGYPVAFLVPPAASLASLLASSSFPGPLR